MKAAIYCRLSKEDENLEGSAQESESIQNQKSMLIQYAVDHGYEIYGIYCDEDYSGIDRDRPDFARMIEAASHRRFEVILAKTQSRFTRDMELVEKYLHGKFVEWGIRFIAVVDHVDTADAAGKKSRQINGLVNEWYLEDLSGNVRSVLDHKRREGKYIASAPLYGYCKDPTDHNRIVVDPPAAAVVQRIFSLCLEGCGSSRIAQILNEENIPSPSLYKQQNGQHCPGPAHPNSDVWGKATVYRILTTRTYAGDLEQGRHRKVSYKSKKTVWLPREEWIVVPDTHEPVIDRDTFDQVQQMLRRRARSSGPGQVHPLAAKVQCGICGAMMEQSSSGCTAKGRDGPVRYFRCRMSQRDRRRCTGQPYMPAAQLEELVLERLRSYVRAYFDPASLDHILLCAEAEKKRQTRQEELRRLRSELERRRRAIQQLYLDKTEGLVPPEQFSQLNEAFLQQAGQLEKRCAALEEELDESTGETRRRQLEQYLRGLLEVPRLDRQLVCLLVDHVTVFPPDKTAGTRRIEIDWRF